MTLPNAKTPLQVPTYDGSGQCVHPDVIRGVSTPFDAKWVMVMEPYPFSKAEFENPSIVVSDNAVRWSEPDGTENPIVPARPGAGWHSDAALLATGGVLHLYYRYNSGAGDTTLLRRTTEDGARWSPEETLLQFDESGRFASPSLFIKDGRVFMVYVDTVNQVIEMFVTDDQRKWVYAGQLLRFPGAWHACARRIGESLYLLITDRHSLHLVRQTRNGLWMGWDGKRWTAALSNRSTPILVPSRSSWDSLMIYHGSFDLQDNRIDLWYSAQSQSGAWQIGHTHGFLGE